MREEEVRHGAVPVPEPYCVQREDGSITVPMRTSRKGCMDTKRATQVDIRREPE